MQGTDLGGQVIDEAIVDLWKSDDTFDAYAILACRLEGSAHKDACYTFKVAVR